MRLDEMIIKANADGKTYVNGIYGEEYSADNGFVCEGETLNSITSSTYISGWQEKSKRHLTVAQAEKELDCVIDTPKLFRAMDEMPGDKRNVIIVSDNYEFNSKYCGFYDSDDAWWRWFSGCNPRIPDTCGYHWIDPADLIKLLPKE